MEAEMKFHVGSYASAVRCLSIGMGRSPPNPGSLFYVPRYPSWQRESKCVLAQGALSLYRTFKKGMELVRGHKIFLIEAS